MICAMSDTVFQIGLYSMEDLTPAENIEDREDLIRMLVEAEIGNFVLMKRFAQVLSKHAEGRRESYATHKQLLELKEKLMIVLKDRKEKMVDYGLELSILPEIPSDTFVADVSSDVVSESLEQIELTAENMPLVIEQFELEHKHLQKVMQVTRLIKEVLENIIETVRNTIDPLIEEHRQKRLDAEFPRSKKISQNDSEDQS